jgi:hypothetical protein
MVCRPCNSCHTSLCCSAGAPKCVHMHMVSDLPFTCCLYLLLGGATGWINNIPVIPGQSYPLAVGDGGMGLDGSGGDSWFWNSTTLMAGASRSSAWWCSHLVLQAAASGTGATAISPQLLLQFWP